MSKRLIIVTVIFLFALAALIAVGSGWSLPSRLFAPQVYLSGQKAYVRLDVPQDTDTNVKAIDTTVCFWTPSMNSAALAANRINNYTGDGFILGPGFVSLKPDGTFHDQLKFDKTTDYGILAVHLISDIEKVTPGKKYPVLPPEPGPATICISDGFGSEGKKYNVEITGIAGDKFTFTSPEGRKLTYSDSGSPVIQNNSFVGAAQVTIGDNDTETNCKGLSAPVMYRELMKTENEG